MQTVTLEHSEFVARSANPTFLWGVDNLRLLRALGPIGRFNVFLLALGAVSPGLIFLVTSVRSQHPAQLLWFPLILLALTAGTPSLSVFESLPWWLLAGLSALLTHWLQWPAPSGGFICLLTWYASGLLRGAAISGLRVRLIRNGRLYERLRQAQCLYLPGA